MKFLVLVFAAFTFISASAFACEIDSDGDFVATSITCSNGFVPQGLLDEDLGHHYYGDQISGQCSGNSGSQVVTFVQTSVDSICSGNRHTTLTYIFQEEGHH